MKYLSLVLFVTFMSQASFAHTLTVKIEGLKSHKGSVYFALFNRKEDFPDRSENAYRKGNVNAADESIIFQDLPDDTYVLSIFHDENENGKLDTFLGIPKEGFGFSNNPRILFGPPSWKDCSFKVNADKEITLKIKDL